MKLKKHIANGLTLGIIIANLPIYTFANNIKNSYYNEISNIQTKEDLQKSVQKAMRAGEFNTWIEGLESMPTIRRGLVSCVLDGKIYCIGGVNGSTCLNAVEVYDPETNTWETKSPMNSSRAYSTSAVVDGKIYCIGGYNGSYLTTVEMYNPATDTWESKASAFTKKSCLTSAVINGKIYCIGGFDGFDAVNTVEVYDPATDSWETKTSMPTARGYLTSAVINNKIYCIGGWYKYGSPLSTVEVYDPETDTWETKTSMPTARRDLTSAVIEDTIYCIGGYNASLASSLDIVESYTVKEISLEEQIIEAIDKAEESKDINDIEYARDLINQLPESIEKEEFQNILNAISHNLSLERKTASANIDVYIKSENMLSLSLDTNSVTFEDFSGVEDLEKQNAVTLTINSSLPYEINSYLVSEMKNANNSETMDKSILNIKANSGSAYESFTDLVTPIKLFDNQVAGNNKVHGIDLKLKGNIAHKADVYKTTIKFEVNQE